LIVAVKVGVIVALAAVALLFKVRTTREFLLLILSVIMLTLLALEPVIGQRRSEGFVLKTRLDFIWFGLLILTVLAIVWK
jgi:hypothetical protein